MAENKEEARETGLQVFINGVSDLKLIPKEKWDSLITALELQISDYYKKEKIIILFFFGFYRQRLI